jgi:thioesterase domain-containing protein/acyl carrier protein
VTEIFAEVFGLDSVDANDDFFDLGGDSLIAEMFAMRLRERTGYDFSLSSLFEHGSPRAIAELLLIPPGESVAWSLAEDDRPPIFLIHGRSGISFPRTDFLPSLAEDQKLHMFELPGLRGGRCYDYVEDIAAVYVAQLLDKYPRGPILLAAFCAGGLIALEMAAQLAGKGRPIHHLVLLDPPMRSLGRAGAHLQWPLPRKWIRTLLEGLLPVPLVRRLRELRYRRLLARRMLEDPLNRAKWAELPFATIPRAKLSAACSVYWPKPYRGPVTVLSSEEPTTAYRAESNLAKLLPQSRVEFIAKAHSDIANPGVGRAMQTAFDAALDRDGTMASHDRKVPIAG